MVSRTSLQTRIATLSATNFILLMSEIASAATIGHTNVYSKQFEPLVATIDVIDIRPDRVSVTTADKSVYQQLTMDYDSDINAYFQADSKNSGKLVLNSSTPLSKPFADVVIVLNDNGKLQLVPKTILPSLDNKRALIKTKYRLSNPKGSLIASLPKLQSATLLPSSLPTSSLKKKSLKNKNQKPNTLLRLNNNRYSTNSLSNIGFQVKRLEIKKSAPPVLKGISSRATLMPNNPIVTIRAPRSLEVMSDIKASKKYNLPEVLEVTITRQIKPI